jgi:diguanylate cyclase (GGDEF)-like protein
LITAPTVRACAKPSIGRESDYKRRGLILWSYPRARLRDADAAAVKAIVVRADRQIEVTGTGRKTDREQADAQRHVPILVSRQRLIERAGHPDCTVFAVAGLVLAILVATAVFRNAWALLPCAVLVASVAVGPAVVRTHIRPEYVELFFGLCITIAMAIAAALTGGTSSPIVFLLPIGVVMNALRAGPESVVFCAVVTIAAFLVASLLHNAHPILSDPLPMVAIAAMQAGVTLASLVLTRAELNHRRASTVDPLTGLLNRQGLPDRFEELRQRALISAAPITLVLFDLDHFKLINDLHGHDVGDRLLRDVADVIRLTLRRFELVYRIGGEEFLILLPGMAEWEGESVAQQLREAIAGLATGVEITASFGVSGTDGTEVGFEQLYRRADQALYRAKRAGRDRVTVSGATALIS